MGGGGSVVSARIGRMRQDRKRKRLAEAVVAPERHSARKISKNLTKRKKKREGVDHIKTFGRKKKNMPAAPRTLDLEGAAGGAARGAKRKASSGGDAGADRKRPKAASQ